MRCHLEPPIQKSHTPCINPGQIFILDVCAKLGNHDAHAVNVSSCQRYTDTDICKEEHGQGNVSATVKFGTSYFVNDILKKPANSGIDSPWMQSQGRIQHTLWPDQNNRLHEHESRILFSAIVFHCADNITNRRRWVCNGRCSCAILHHSHPRPHFPFPWRFADTCICKHKKSRMQQSLLPTALKDRCDLPPSPPLHNKRANNEHTVQS